MTRKANPVEKGVGFALISGGSFTLIKSLHIFENGAIDFDSVIHTEISDRGGQGVVVSDGGVDMTCDAAWVIKDFGYGLRRHLLGDGFKGEPRLEPADMGDKLTNEIHRVAGLISLEKREGTLVVTGSTDTLKYAHNADLARDRAQTVANELQKVFATKGAPLKVILGNELFSAESGAAAGSVSSNGLARLVIGHKEIADRSAMICMIEERPHRVEAGAGGGGAGMALPFMQGFGVGVMALALALACAVLVLVGVLLSRRMAQDRAKPGDKDGAVVSGTPENLSPPPPAPSGSSPPPDPPGPSR